VTTPRVGICLPAHRTVEVATTMSLCGLVRHETERKGADLRILAIRDSLLPRGRQDLVERSLRMGCTHILFVDSDMRFPEESLEVLLSRGEPFVAANYPTRNPPYSWTAQTSKRVATYPDSEGLEAVTVVGLGLALLESRLFVEMARPWFAFEWCDDGSMMPEDTYLCMRLYESHGIRPVIDHELSKRVRHIGDIAVGGAMVELHEKLEKVQ
jgi:hypothetical protein